MSLSFGKNSNNSAPTAARAAAAGKTDKAPAEYWMNIGYTQPVDSEDGSTVEVFVSLNSGIALDDVKPMDVSSSNQEYAAKAVASNEFHAALLAKAKTLQPGESVIISSCETTGIQTQLRRVRDKTQQTVTNENNPLLRKFEF